MAAAWHSTQMDIVYNVLGWTAFVAWSISFYPQLILNFRRKSVVGLNFDFVVLNLTKHSSYLIYNASLFFSPAVQKQYRRKFGSDQMIPVAANDVAFSTHAVLVTAFTLFQIAIYDRGSQKVSKICIAIVSVVWLAAAILVCIAIPHHSWLWLASCFNTLQVTMTLIKYIPQAVMNFRRKSTTGFSIGNILLDLFGGVTNYGQMAVQSIDQHSWVNFYGNIGKTLLSLVSILFDILFILQHYVFYPSSKKLLKTPEAHNVDSAGVSRDAEEVYCWVIGSNLILRCTWTYKLSAHLRHNYLTVFTIAPLEIVRRFQWVFFRLENEWNKMTSKSNVELFENEIPTEEDRLLISGPHNV